MAFTKRQQFRHRSRPDQPTDNRPEALIELANPEQTGTESAYLKSLVDSQAWVTVVMADGEKFRGRVRYYDRECFSLGLSAAGPRLLLRKDKVSYIAEE